MYVSLDEMCFRIFRFGMSMSMSDYPIYPSVRKLSYNRLIFAPGDKLNIPSILCYKKTKEKSQKKNYFCGFGNFDKILSLYNRNRIAGRCSTVLVQT